MGPRTANRNIDTTLSGHEKVTEALAMLPEAFDGPPDRERIDKIIEDVIFDFDTLFSHEQRTMGDSRYRLLTAHENDHNKIMDLLSSLRYANRIEILSWDDLIRIIRDCFHCHVEYFDKVFIDYIRLKRDLSRSKPATSAARPRTRVSGI